MNFKALRLSPESATTLDFNAIDFSALNGEDFKQLAAFMPIDQLTGRAIRLIHENKQSLPWIDAQVTGRDRSRQYNSNAPVSLYRSRPGSTTKVTAHEGRELFFSGNRTSFIHVDKFGAFDVLKLNAFTKKEWRDKILKIKQKGDDTVFRYQGHTLARLTGIDKSDLVYRNRTFMLADPDSSLG